MSVARPPITCHVLDTTTGKPAAGVEVILDCRAPQSATLSPHFIGRTNEDGRVTTWVQEPATTPATPVQEVFKSTKGDALWELTFKTGDYFAKHNVKPFFPEVVLKIMVRSQEEHYHVPLLLGPFNYTTYRGS